METSVVISASALAFSVVSFAITMFEKRARNRIQDALFDLQRDTSFEARLADWPSALKFHGIDLEAARKEDISPKDIAYLVLSVGALCAYCTSHGKKIYDYLTESDYRQRMFDQQPTRETWKYARHCFPSNVRDDIDRFITQTHKQSCDRPD